MNPSQRLITIALNTLVAVVASVIVTSLVTMVLTAVEAMTVDSAASWIAYTSAGIGVVTAMLTAFNTSDNTPSRLS
jgi:hypothetical protein